MEFLGYLRKNGPAGVRNYVAIIPTVGCVNEAALRIANQVDEAMPFLHHQGCCQLKSDYEKVSDVLAGIGNNPNVCSVLLVSL